MKAGDQLPEVKELLLERGCKAYMVENCGMADERIFTSAEEIDENAGYLSVMIVKE